MVKKLNLLSLFRSFLIKSKRIHEIIVLMNYKYKLSLKSHQFLCLCFIKLVYFFFFFVIAIFTLH